MTLAAMGSHPEKAEAPLRPFLFLQQFFPGCEAASKSQIVGRLLPETLN